MAAPYGNNKARANEIYSEIENYTKALRKKEITKEAYDRAMARLRAELESL